MSDTRLHMNMLNERRENSEKGRKGKCKFLKFNNLTMPLVTLFNAN